MTEGLQEKLNQAEDQWQHTKDKWTRLEAEHQLLASQLTRKEEELRDMEETLATYEKVTVLLQQSAEFARSQAKEQIETLVTNALQYVFGPDISFQIEIDEQGQRTVAEFFVVSEMEGTKVKTKPAEARGGGVVDIVSLALRVAFLETIQPKAEGPLLLDEPGKHLSNEYELHLYEFLKSLSTMFHRQVIMITHNQHLAESGDKAFYVELDDGISGVSNSTNA
ncbi:ATPase [Alteribacter populi]|uniref:ATPase n=1 Tax=Alteribacter populi TaxID=2011011 RepID=UPI000BBB473F|nr:ATPase [Alteribacter populi]